MEEMGKPVLCCLDYIQQGMVNHWRFLSQEMIGSGLCISKITLAADVCVCVCVCVCVFDACKWARNWYPTWKIKPQTQMQRL